MPAAHVAASPIHGTGVFAACSFAAGATVLIIDDSRVVDEQHPLRADRSEYPYHCDYLADGRTVLMPSPERHINSCCDPNTYVRTIDGVRHVIARRAITPNEEITYDYIINCDGGLVWQCRCGSPCCRRIIPGSFFDLPLDQQTEYLPLLDTWFVAEHQPHIDTLRQHIATLRD